MFKSTCSLVSIILISLGSIAAQSETVELKSFSPDLIQVNDQRNGYTAASKPLHAVQSLILEVADLIESKTGEASAIEWPQEFSTVSETYPFTPGQGRAFTDKVVSASKARTEVYNKVTDLISKGNDSLLGIFVVQISNSDKCIMELARSVEGESDCKVAKQVLTDLNFILDRLSAIRIAEHTFEMSVGSMGVVLESKIRRRGRLSGSFDAYQMALIELEGIASVIADQMRILAAQVTE